MLSEKKALIMELRNLRSEAGKLCGSNSSYIKAQRKLDNIIFNKEKNNEKNIERLTLEMKELGPKLDKINSLYAEKQEKLDEIIRNENKYEVNGFIYITNTYSGDSDYTKNYYTVGYCLDLVKIDDYTHTFEVENVEAVKGLLDILLKENAADKSVISYSLKNLIDIVNNICSTFSGNIVPSMNNYITKNIEVKA